MRSTRNIKSLFLLKDKISHQSCVIYEEQCSCKLNYIGETKRNSEVRWREHEDPAGNSEPAKHLMGNASHKFAWKMFSAAPSHFFSRKSLEAFLIVLRIPALNDQLWHHSFSLFRHGITKWYFVHIASLLMIVDCFFYRIISLMPLLTLLIYIVLMKK